jgi:hypothetical protein
MRFLIVEIIILLGVRVLELVFLDEKIDDFYG